MKHYHTDEIHEILKNVRENEISDEEAEQLFREIEHERLVDFILTKFNQGFFTDVLDKIPEK